MIVFFALLGISCKRKIPEAHTSLELVRIRYGESIHLVPVYGFANLPRTNCPCRLHDPVSGQQHLRQCQYAAGSCSCHCSSVSILL